jgi:hypothetical protein
MGQLPDCVKLVYSPTVATLGSSAVELACSCFSPRVGLLCSLPGVTRLVTYCLSSTECVLVVYTPGRCQIVYMDHTAW